MKISALLAFLSLPVLGFAETPEKLLEQLREEVRMELRASLDKENDANNERLVRLEGILIEEIPDHDVTSGKLNRTLGGLLKLRTFTKSKKAEELVGELIVPVRKAMVQEQERLVEVYEPTLHRALVSGLKSDKEEELDAALAAVQALKKKLAEFTDADGNQLELVDSDLADTVMTALRGWQNGVIGLTSKPPEFWTAVDALKEMEANYEEGLMDVVPRSEFRSLLRGCRERWKLEAFEREREARVAAETRKILQGVRKFDGLAGALESLRTVDVRPGGDVVGEFTETQRVMHVLEEIKQDFSGLESGFTTVVPERPQILAKPAPSPARIVVHTEGPEGGADSEVSNTVSTEVLSELQGLYERLVLTSLPKCLATDEQPAAGEGVAAYLQGHAMRAVRERNWSRLGRVLDTAEQVHGAGIFSPRDTTALRYLLAAANQERARRHASAVASYLVALRSGSQAVPAEWIGDQLAAIEKEHAQEFEAGQHLAPEPLPPARPPGYPEVPVAPGNDDSGVDVLSAPKNRPLPR